MSLGYFNDPSNYAQYSNIGQTIGAGLGTQFNSEGKFKFDKQGAYGVAANVLGQVQTPNRSVGGSIAKSLAPSLISTGNPYAAAAGAALYLGGNIYDAYKYDPQSIDVGNSFNSSNLPVNTIQSRGQYENQMDKYTGIDNVLTFGGAKRKYNDALDETIQNRRLAQGRLNEATQGFYENRNQQMAMRNDYERKLLGLSI